MQRLLRNSMIAGGAFMLVPLVIGCNRTSATVLTPLKQPHPVAAHVVDQPIREIPTPAPVLAPPDPLSAAADRLAADSHYDPSSANRTASTAVTGNALAPTAVYPPPKKGYSVVEAPCGCTDTKAAAAQAQSP